MTTPSPQHTPEDELDKLIDNLAVTASMVGHGHARTEAQKGRLRAYLDTKVREARVDENEYWHELSKIFQRGILPVDFKDRISELTQEQTR